MKIPNIYIITLKKITLFRGCFIEEKEDYEKKMN